MTFPARDPFRMRIEIPLIRTLMIVTLLLASTANAAVNDVLDMTVCEIYASDHTPADTPIRIKATAYMVLKHGAMLGDKSCSSGSKIGLRFAEDIKTGSTADAFRNALIGDVMKIGMRIFDLQAVGTYLSEPRSTRGTKGTFIIEKIDWFRKSDELP